MKAYLSCSAEFIGSQIEEETRRPLTYMGSPWRLLIDDIRFFFQNIFYLPFIFLPLYPWPNGPLDELYPSLANLQDLSIHFVLFFGQLGFLISLPFLTYLSVSLYVSYIGLALGLSYLICRLLNSGISDDGLRSTDDEFSRTWEPHPEEYWIFLNGICVGKNWLQHNVDRLSRTFHRPVVGVHNETFGVVFDLVQCLIQRALLYATSDVRTCYVLVKKALYRPEIKKVVLILHSQGGIEGGMILDWLLNEVPQDLLQNLEIYTFACLANHFNNPYRLSGPSMAPPEYPASGAAYVAVPRQRTISHIEHYANAYDFAAKWGVLQYTRTMPQNKLENRFMGTVLVNPKAGHQLNQHYLGSIFPLDPTGRFTRDPEEGDFMLMDAYVGQSRDHDRTESPVESLYKTQAAPPFSRDRRRGGERRDDEIEGPAVLNISPTSSLNVRNTTFPTRNGGSIGGTNTGLKMWQLSRLWQYRNGKSPVPIVNSGAGFGVEGQD